MSLTTTERRYLAPGLPCPMHWTMALAYVTLLICRPLDYDEAIDVLGYNPAFDHPEVREWLEAGKPVST